MLRRILTASAAILAVMLRLPDPRRMHFARRSHEIQVVAPGQSEIMIPDGLGDRMFPSSSSRPGAARILAGANSAGCRPKNRGDGPTGGRRPMEAGLRRS